MLDGIIKIYDEELQIVNEYKKNEIFGLEEFTKFCDLKYQLDIDMLFKEYKEKSEQFDKKTFKKMIINKIAKSDTTISTLSTKSVKRRNSKDNGDEEYKIQFKNQAIGRDNIK